MQPLPGEIKPHGENVGAEMSCAAGILAASSQDDTLYDEMKTSAELEDFHGHEQRKRGS